MTEGYEILLNIFPAVAPKDSMMNLQLLRAPANLTPPAVPVQDLKP
jgi:hypothetical protein